MGFQFWKQTVRGSSSTQNLLLEIAGKPPMPASVLGGRESVAPSQMPWVPLSGPGILLLWLLNLWPDALGVSARSFISFDNSFFPA